MATLNPSMTPSACDVRWARSLTVASRLCGPGDLLLSGTRIGEGRALIQRRGQQVSDVD